MQRDLLTTLEDWKTASDRKPLILQGARQVGKTTILRQFANKAYKNHIYLNFEDKPALKQLFLEDLDPKRILKLLSVQFSTTIVPGDTLLIFDEIQESPEALNSLKYFCENANEQHICAAGSLLGVKLAHAKGFPVGKVNFKHLYPLSFFEFLSAIDENKLREYLTSINTIAPLPQIFHNKLITLFKHYLYIGGMPETVAEYAKNRDLNKIREIQLAVLDAYALDFAKHAPKTEIMRITEVWQSLPSQLAKENKKFLYSVIRSSARGRIYENAIQWLVDAGLIHKIYNISTPKLPLKAYAQRDIFKVYLLDVGLLGTMADMSAKILLEDEKLFYEFRGSFIENFVSQALKQHTRELHYWTSSGKAELDFVIQHEQHIIPIEVKSGTSRKKKSLQSYINKYKPDLAVVISPLNLKSDGNILNCPFYLVDVLPKLLNI